MSSIKEAADNTMYYQEASVSSIKETVSHVITLNFLSKETMETIVASCAGKIALYSCVGALSGGLGFCLIVAIIPPLLGFTVSGILAGSLGALCMACHGGFTPAGGIVATMQWTGTLGIYAGFNPKTFILGTVIGLFLGAYLATSNSPDVCIF